MNESANVFYCGDAPLVGITHNPDIPVKTGVIIILAGGPQYRVGAHRQFVTLGRQLADQGFPVLRFDHRGVGDSGGSYQGFLNMDDDIKAAIDLLYSKYPALDNVVLWGECESASAAAFYAHNDSRVSSLFMVNPWIRTSQGQAKTYLKHYYLNRFRDPEFWKKLKSGQFSLFESLKSYFQLMMHARKPSDNNSQTADKYELSSLALPLRYTKSLQLFNGSCFVLTSGNDYIAQEFKDFMVSSEAWQKSGLNETIKFYEMHDADHTFSRTEWRDELFEHTEKWLRDEVM
jgi:exosortase A-associated hydrolase 1